MHTVIDCRNILMVNNCIQMWLLTVKTFQQSITTPVQDGYSLLKPLKFTIETHTFSCIFHQSRAIGLKVSTFALYSTTTTISKNLESAIDMSNLMLKYIPQDTMFYRT